MNNKSLSVIIPTYNAEAELKLCLEALQQQLEYILEIIIVDDGSSVPILLAQYPHIRVIRHAMNFGPSRARNTGLQAAASDYIVFIDSDIIIPEGALSRVSSLFQESSLKKMALTCARHRLRLEDEISFCTLYKELYMSYVFLNHQENVDFLYGGFCAFKRPESLIWPTDMRYAEDTFAGQLLFESGYTIKLLNDFEITHLKNYSLMSLLKHSFIIAFHFNQSLLAKKKISLHHSHATAHQLISIILTAALFLACLLNQFSLVLLFISLWLFHNRSFIGYLNKYLSYQQMMMAILLTVLDQLAKGLGILSGFLFFGLRHQLKKRKFSQSRTEYRGNK